MRKCPDCNNGKLTFDSESKLERCEYRNECGYGWFDIKGEDNA